MQKYLDIFEGMDAPAAEGFYGVDDAIELIGERLSAEPTGPAFSISISDEKPIRNEDLLNNPGLVRHDQDTFTIMIFGRQWVTVSNQVETQGFVEQSDKRAFDRDEVLDIVRSLYANRDDWRSLFKLERQERVTDHESHAKMLRAIEAAREGSEQTPSPYPAWVWWGLGIIIVGSLLYKVLRSV